MAGPVEVVVVAAAVVPAAAEAVFAEVPPPILEALPPAVLQHIPAALQCIRAVLQRILAVFLCMQGGPVVLLYTSGGLPYMWVVFPFTRVALPCMWAGQRMSISPMEQSEFTAGRPCLMERR